MKKKHRDIWVQGDLYGWTIKTDDEFHTVKIWFGGKVIHTELVPEHLIVAPGFIRDVILSLNSK